jgi:Rrf2 family protein
MQITRATDYAVRVTVHLATRPAGQKVPLGELAEATGVRDNFLSKILQRLVRNGVVTSHRGTGGGFLLNVAAKDLTLLQVVEAIEGKIELNICLSEWQRCPLQAQCAVHPVWQKAQLAIAKELAAVTIAELATQTTEKSRAFLSGEQRESPPKPGE